MTRAISAYVGDGRLDGMGVDKSFGQTYDLNNAGGINIGSAMIGKSWFQRSTYGRKKVFQVYAYTKGRSYTGRCSDFNCSIVFRETAASKRKWSKDHPDE